MRLTVPRAAVAGLAAVALVVGAYAAGGAASPERTAEPAPEAVTARPFDLPRLGRAARIPALPSTAASATDTSATHVVADSDDTRSRLPPTQPQPQPTEPDLPPPREEEDASDPLVPIGR